MHYQLFLPQITVASHSHLNSFGLKSLCDPGPSMTMLGPDGTPFGCPGALCSWDPDHFQFDPLWNWQKVGDYWIGVHPDSPPTPADLRRAAVVPGVDVTLGDGLPWHFPHHRKVEHTFQVDPDSGEIVRAPLPEMLPFIQRCASAIETIYTAVGLSDIWEAIEHKAGPLPEEHQVVTVRDGFGLVCEALGINYRINDAIAVVLNLFNDDTVRQAMVNVIELPQIHLELGEQQYKKKRGFDVSLNVTQPM